MPCILPPVSLAYTVLSMATLRNVMGLLFLGRSNSLAMKYASGSFYALSMDHLGLKPPQQGKRPRGPSGDSHGDAFTFYLIS